MKPFRISLTWLSILLFRAWATAWAGDPSLQWELSDHGRMTRFLVATNEIHRPHADKPQPITSQEGLSGLRSHLASGRTKSDAAWELVLYPEGMPTTADNRRYLGSELVVCLKQDVDRTHIATLPGIQSLAPIDGLPSWYLVRVGDPVGVLELSGVLRQRSDVSVVEPQLARQAHKKFIPKDPYFAQQWHLRNTGASGGLRGNDLHVTNVWDRWHGKGVHIAVVDDGLQYTHPDLAAGYDSASSFDFNYNDADPAPNVAADDSHGTAVAGVIGARANNGRGGTGVAFESSISGIRLIALPATDREEAAAMLHSNAVIQIKNNSWGAEDCPTQGTALEGPGPLAKAALEEGVKSGRGGLGEIYVWASGNGGDCDEDVNYDGYANSIEVISVGALDYTGNALSYSEHGACIMVSAPSGDFGLLQVLTTDLLGEYGENYTGAPDDLGDVNYTRNFNGTSASCPMVAGVVGLMLEAAPGLGWRDVQEILLRSSAKVLIGDSGWTTNSAGVPHHYLFGAGRVDAEAALRMATNWANLSPALSLTQSVTGLNAAITATGLTNEFVFDSPGFRVEHVAVTVSTTHPNWGDIEIRLISPLGYESRLARPHSANPHTDYRGWTLTSVRHWGEPAQGKWRIIMTDSFAGNNGVLNDLRVALIGSRPEPRLSLEMSPSQSNLILQVPAVGWAYVLEASEDLKSWTPLGNFTIPGSGQVEYLDIGSAGRRFYWARRL